MVFKEMVVYLLDGKGGYTCSDDMQAEKELYLGFEKGTQSAVDHARQLDPSVTPEFLKGYITNDIGSIMTKAKECLESYGYDTSTLPQVVIPEFGDVASLVFKIGMAGATMAGIYAAKYIASKKDFGKI